MTLEQLPIIMARALFLTIIIEEIVAIMLGIRNRKDYLTLALVNVITNPLIVSTGAAVMLFAGHRYAFAYTMTMEIVVILMEALLYKKYLLCDINPFILSTACNAVSFITGELLNRYCF